MFTSGLCRRRLLKSLTPFLCLGVKVVWARDVPDWRRSHPTMPEQSNDYRVVVFGAGGVGKSSLVLRFVKGTFRESYIPTIEDTYRQVADCDWQTISYGYYPKFDPWRPLPIMFTLTFIKQWIFVLKRQIQNQQQETIDLEDYSNDARWPIDNSLNGSTDGS